MHGGVYILDDFWLLIQVNSCRHVWIEELREVRHFVRSPRCDWLQHSRPPHKLGPVLSSPHASPAAAPRPSTAFWRGFEPAHGCTRAKCHEIRVDLLLRGVRLWLSPMSAAALSRTKAAEVIFKEHLVSGQSLERAGPWRRVDRIPLISPRHHALLPVLVFTLPCPSDWSGVVESPV